MPRSDRPARPVRRRLLAPIAALLTAAGLCAVLAALIGTATPAAAAVGLPNHRTSPILPFPSFPAVGSSSGNPQTSAPAVTQSSPKAVASHGRAGKGPAIPIYSATFTPQALPTQAPPTSAGPCTPDTKAPTSGADLQLPQIAGNSTDSGYQGWLPVKAVGPTTMLPPQLASANLTTLTLTRAVDPQSTNLSMAASSGTRFSCALLDVAAGNGYQRIDYALTNAGFISEIQKGSTEYLTVTYSQISWNYVASAGASPQTGSGVVDAKPDQQQASVRHGAELVGAGVLGLALLCALGLLGLTLVGRHRRKVRYRQVRERSRQVAAEQAQRAQFTAMARVGGMVRVGETAQFGGRLPQAPGQAQAVQQPMTAMPVPEELREVKVTQFSHSEAMGETADTVLPAEENTLQEDVPEAETNAADAEPDESEAEDSAVSVDADSEGRADSEDRGESELSREESPDEEQSIVGEQSSEESLEAPAAEESPAEDEPSSPDEIPGDSDSTESSPTDESSELPVEPESSDEPESPAESESSEDFSDDEQPAMSSVADPAPEEPAEPIDADTTAESDSDDAESSEDSAADSGPDAVQDSGKDSDEGSGSDAVSADEGSPADA